MAPDALVADVRHSAQCCCGVVLGHLIDSSEIHNGSDRLRTPKPQSQQWGGGGGAGRHSGACPRRAGVRQLTESHHLHIVLGKHNLETVMTSRCRPLQVCVFRTACAAKRVARHVPRASMRPIQHQPRQDVLRLSRAPSAGMRPRRRCCRLAAAPRCSRSWTRSASRSCGSRSVPSSSFYWRIAPISYMDLFLVKPAVQQLGTARLRSATGPRKSMNLSMSVKWDVDSAAVAGAYAKCRPCWTHHDVQTLSSSQYARR